MTEFKYFKLGDLFKIEKVTGFNKNELRNNANGKYDYVTRTSLNNGVESITDKVPNRIPNEPHTFSLGLLQMTFFYRERPWYAGQFIRKITPKFKNSDLVNLYMLTCLRKISRILLGVLVRDVDNTFNNISIKLPIDTKTNELDFKYMEDRVKALANYLTITGLDNYKLTKDDKNILSTLPRTKSFTIGELMVGQTGDVDIQNKDISDQGEWFINSGVTNRGIKGKTTCKAKIFPGNTITIDFFGNANYRSEPYKLATHNHVFSYSGDVIKNEKVGLYLVSTMKFLTSKYSYSNMATRKSLKDETLELPIDAQDNIDFKYMEYYIAAIQKLTIKNVIKYKDEVINKTKEIIN